jgi:hypothetical protein
MAANKDDPIHHVWQVFCEEGSNPSLSNCRVTSRSPGSGGDMKETILKDIKNVEFRGLCPEGLGYVGTNFAIKEAKISGLGSDITCTRDRGNLECKPKK